MSTINDRLRTGALDGATDEFNVGASTAEFVLSAGASELATLTLSDPAFAPATISGGKAVASANAITKDTTVTPGDIDTFALTDKDLVVLISGTVGIAGSGADFIVTDNIIPAGATEVSCPTLTLSLALA